MNELVATYPPTLGKSGFADSMINWSSVAIKPKLFGLIDAMFLNWRPKTILGRSFNLSAAALAAALVLGG